MVCIRSPKRSAAYYANLRDCTPSKDAPLRLVSTAVVEDPSIALVVASVRYLVQPNLKSSAVLRLCLNKNDRSQSSPRAQFVECAVMEENLVLEQTGLACQSRSIKYDTTGWAQPRSRAWKASICPQAINATAAAKPANFLEANDLFLSGGYRYT